MPVLSSQSPVSSHSHGALCFHCPSRFTACSLLCSVVLGTPIFLAILARGMPISTSRRTCSITSSETRFGLPSSFPDDLAAAMPSRCRSRISDRSNSAKAPSICIIRRLMGSELPWPSGENRMFSLWNTMVTPLVVRESTSCCKWRRFLARRSMLWT